MDMFFEKDCVVYILDHIEYDKDLPFEATYVLRKRDSADYVGIHVPLDRAFEDVADDWGFAPFIIGG